MKAKFTLSIDKPCSEKFDQFQGTRAGGFCGSCQKEVIDFTKMTDQELINYFKKQSKNTCGRFSQPQLKAYSEATLSPKKGRFNLLGAGLMGFSLLSFLSTNTSQAQNKHQQASLVISPQLTAVNQTADSRLNKDGYIATGIVVDEEGEAIPFVTIVLKGTTTGVMTDIDGKFRFNQIKAGDVLIFNYVGYITQEFVITENAQNISAISIKMKADYFDIMGEVSINKVYSSKPSLWQRFKALFR